MVWEERTDPPWEYSGKYHRRLSSGGFSVCEWPSNQGATISWNGIHVKYIGVPFMKPVSDDDWEVLARELENIFMTHVPISELENHNVRKEYEAREEGRAALQEELRELLNAAPLEPC